MSNDHELLTLVLTTFILLTIKFDLIKADSARRNQKPVTLRGTRLEIEIQSNIIYSILLKNYSCPRRIRCLSLLCSVVKLPLGSWPAHLVAHTRL